MKKSFTCLFALLFSLSVSAAERDASIDEQTALKTPTKEVTTTVEPMSDEELQEIAEFLATALVERVGEAYLLVKNDPIWAMMLVYGMLKHEGANLANKLGQSAEQLRSRVSMMLHAIVVYPYSEKAREGFLFTKYFISSLLEALNKDQQNENENETEAEPVPAS